MYENRVENIIDTIIESVRNQQILLKHLPDYRITNEEMNKEFKTMQFKFPRKFGNTTIAVELLKRLKNSTLWYPTKFWSDVIKKEKVDDDNLDNKKDLKSRIKYLKDSQIIGTKYEIVIIDNTSWISTEKLSEIYKKLFCDTIILIG